MENRAGQHALQQPRGLLIDGMNRAAGCDFVTTQTGGRRGGGAALTERGRFAVATFRSLLDQVRRSAAGALSWLTGPEAGAVHVACAASLEGVLRQLLVDFSAVDPTATVRAVTGASDELAGHLLAGAPADLFLTADPAGLGRLEDAGLLEPGSAVTLARNGLARKLRDSDLDPDIENSFERLSTCVAEMRDVVSRTRMQRVDRLFAAIPRMVRDLSHELSKKVELVLEGDRHGGELLLPARRRQAPVLVPGGVDRGARLQELPGGRLRDALHGAVRDP